MLCCSSPGNVSATFLTKWTNAPGGVASTTSDKKLNEDDDDDDDWPSTDAVSSAGKGCRGGGERRGEAVGSVGFVGLVGQGGRVMMVGWYVQYFVCTDRHQP